MYHTQRVLTQTRHVRLVLTVANLTTRSRTERSDTNRTCVSLDVRLVLTLSNQTTRQEARSDKNKTRASVKRASRNLAPYVTRRFYRRQQYQQ